ncbi:M20 metallopeptidase family protein [Mycolicibacterium komossense]|uniref:Amidohydrolase n=1 Tax=Mycolicibacterium komossense TaxID=1779 RepID=A0ABT3CIZ5_9MYCO|nr:M20 family metallopeptidase [Mycolicibacterium komossense]MCV7229420.1 amidohydrolase [Mycolicibacterium komossense]
MNSIVTTRRELHEHPEVGLHLPWTQRYLLDRLQAAGIECRRGTELSSVIAIVRGHAAPPDRPRVAVLVRSDMDALPLVEETGLPWAATNGAMHACGHDCHMAIVLHAALEVQRRRRELTGDAIFFFQPGEEGHGGAQLALAEGLLDVVDVRPVAVLGLHVLAHHLARGRVVSREGAVLAGSTLVDVVFTGRGGHGSAPHLTRDPITAAAAFVTACSTMMTMRVAPQEHAVLTFGSVHSGAARNVIPDSAELGGVIRGFSEESIDRVEELLRSTAAGVAMSYGVTATVTARKDTVPTLTAGDELARFEEIRGGEVEILDEPLAIAEDFSWVLREVPGVFLLIGATTADDPASSPSNHSARATFDDRVLQPSADLVVDWVYGRLRSATAVTS